MRGEVRQVQEVLAHARRVAERVVSETPHSAPAAQAGGSLPVPAPAGNAGRRHSSYIERKDDLGRRLATWANAWGDSKTDPELDALIAEAREVAWLP